jgi:hypothetical protein
MNLISGGVQRNIYANHNFTFRKMRTEAYTSKDILLKAVNTVGMKQPHSRVKHYNIWYPYYTLTPIQC